MENVFITGPAKNNDGKPETNEQRYILFIHAIYCNAAKINFMINKITFTPLLSPVGILFEENRPHHKQPDGNQCFGNLP
jgi:hypothetical protein